LQEINVAEIDGELIYEILKSIQQDIRTLKEGQGELRQEVVSVRLTQLGMQNDIHNIYGVLARQDDRLERIEKRLELHELAESQRPFDHNT
jgi:hypothetical protein